jgi:hypothetical protein
MGNTTTLIVEYLVAGTLTILAIILAVLSFFPGVALGGLRESLPERSTLAFLFGLSIAFLATAYALGILVEFLGERLFEWLLYLVKIKRMRNYLIKEKELLKHSPLLKPFLIQEPKKQEQKKLAQKIRDLDEAWS